MKRIAHVVLVLTFVLFFAHVPALGAEADPASAVPGTAMLYVETAPEFAQQALAVAALPPLAKIITPIAQSPFSYVDQVLGLPAGTADRAAPHLTRLAFALDGEGPIFLFAFDGPDWPDSLLTGKTRGPEGVVTLVEGDLAAAARDEFLFLSSPDLCTRLRLADYASLASLSDFASAREGAAGPPLWVYASAPECLAAMRSNMPPRKAEDLNGFLALSGLDGARSVVLACKGSPAVDALSITVDVGTAGRGILGLMPEGGLDIAAAVPEGPAAALMVNWGDASAFFGGLRSVVIDLDAQVGGGDLPLQLVEQEARMGVTLDQLFAQMGSGFAVYYPRAADGQLIDRNAWTAILDLKEPGQFGASFSEIILSTSGEAPVAKTHEGVAMSQLFMPPIHYAIADDKMVVGGGPAAVKDYLDWQSAADKAALFAEVPGASAMLRLDLGYLLQSYPETRSGTKLQLALGRKGRQVTLAAGVEDYEAESFLQEYAKAYTFAIGAMMMPALGRARGEAKKSNSRSNLHQIGVGIAMYRNDNNGEYPPSLEPLLQGGYVDDPRVFTDPEDGAPVQRGDMGLRYSYEYPGGLPQGLPPDTIICYSRKGIHPGGRNVLYADSVVLWVSEQVLHDPNGGGRTSLIAGYEAVVAAYGGQAPGEHEAALRKFYEIDE